MHQANPSLTRAINYTQERLDIICIPNLVSLKSDRASLSEYAQYKDLIAEIQVRNMIGLHVYFLNWDLPIFARLMIVLLIIMMIV